MFLVIIVFATGMAWLVIGMTGRSFTSDENSEAEIPGLSGEVTITRDRYGVPYITAQNENDAMAALGYAHAQDRLWQMDMARRYGEGRLSEILGSEMIAFDAFARTMSFRQIADDVYRKMPKSTKAAVQAYCEGVNTFIRENQSRFPFEFDALGYAPEKWDPVHCVLVMRLLAWEENTAFWTDLVYDGLRARLDSARFSEIAPWYPSYAPTIIPGGQRPEPQLEALRAGSSPAPQTDSAATDSTRIDSVGVENDSSAQADASAIYQQLESLIELDRSTREAIGMGGSGIGSNAWAISGERTASGKPLLANDPHFQQMAPCKLYQAVLLIKDRTVAGLTLPGMPFVIAGRNDAIAWGITNLKADETDFYHEKLDPSGKHRVLHDGEWEKLDIRYDTIHTRDTLDTPIEIRSSRHGPLISDLARLIRNYSLPLLDTLAGQAMLSTGTDSTGLAVRWLGRDISHELTAFQKINSAKNFREFKAAAEFGGMPGLSLVYADKAGSIGYVPCFRAPVRNDAFKNRINPGWDSRYNWRGSYDVSDLPTLLNPEQGYIASANNNPSNSLGRDIGDLWADPSRAMRLEEYLSEGNSFEVIDCSQLQVDAVSEHMRYMTEFLLRAFPDSLKQGAKVREALALFRSWNGEMGAGTPEAAIAAEWSRIVFQKTWKDEMGPNLYRHFMQITDLPLKTIRRHLMTDSRWFDDISTTGREVRDDILRKALGEALETLHERFGDWEIGSWHFGKMHALAFDHPFSTYESLRNVLDIGPFETGGSATTLNTAEWSFNDPYAVRVGPSARQIVDFADTTVFLHSVLATGQSGQAMNDHYQDQTIIYLFGGYVSLYNHIPVEADIASVTTLNPGQREEDEEENS